MKTTRPLICIWKRTMPPLASAHVGLLDHDPSAFVQPSQNPPAKVHVLLQVTLQANHAFVSGVDPDLAGHCGQNLCLQVRRGEIRVGPEGEFLHIVL